MVEAKAGERSLEYAPTWAVVTIISCFVVISLLFERSLHWLGLVSNSFHFSLTVDSMPIN